MTKQVFKWTEPRYFLRLSSSSLKSVVAQYFSSLDEKVDLLFRNNQKTILFKYKRKKFLGSANHLKTPAIVRMINVLKVYVSRVVLRLQGHQQPGVCVCVCVCVSR